MGENGDLAHQFRLRNVQVLRFPPGWSTQWARFLERSQVRTIHHQHRTDSFVTSYLGAPAKHESIARIVSSRALFRGNPIGGSDLASRYSDTDRSVISPVSPRLRKRQNLRRTVCHAAPRLRFIGCGGREPQRGPVESSTHRRCSARRFRSTSPRAHATSSPSPRARRGDETRGAKPMKGPFLSYSWAVPHCTESL